MSSHVRYATFVPSGLQVPPFSPQRPSTRVFFPVPSGLSEIKSPAPSSVTTSLSPDGDHAGPDSSYPNLSRIVLVPSRRFSRVRSYVRGAIPAITPLRAGTVAAAWDGIQTIAAATR